MRKYIILFLLFSVFGNAQYNLFARQNFAKSVSAPTYNTYIGGVSATISSASALATKLGISVGAISNFTVVGSDIKCKITGSYAIPANTFLTDSNITYYNDSDGLVTSLGSESFKTTNSILYVYFPNVTSVSDTAFVGMNSSSALKYIYIPRCTSLGSTSGNNNVFEFTTGTYFVYIDSSLQTNNGGSPDGDLSDAISRGATVRYVTNFTAPSAITTLAAGTVYNTTIQLSFTPPSSTNAIDYYEVYKDGIYLKKIYANGEYITGLTASTSYTFTLVAVDVFFNKSTISNSLTQSTNTTSAIPTTGLVSYYKLDSNSNDSHGSNNGTDTDVSYVSGKVNNAGSYNGTTSRTVIGNPANLQLSTGSISCWVKASSAGSSDRFLFGKTLAYGCYIRDGVVTVYSWAGATGSKTTGVNINDGLWHHIVYVFESGTSLNYVYIDGVLKLTTSITVSAQTDPVTIGDSNYSQKINAIIDECNIYNVKLSQTEIDLIYNSGNGTTL